MGYWVQDLSEKELDERRREDIKYAAAIMRAAAMSQPNRNGVCHVSPKDIERELNEISGK